jgi:hypothetical protein
MRKSIGNAKKLKGVEKNIKSQYCGKLKDKNQESSAKKK